MAGRFQAGHLPLLFEDTGPVFLGTANRFRQSLETGSLFEKSDILRGLGDAVAPESGAAVALEDCRNMRIDLQLLGDEGGLGDSSIDIHRNLPSQRMALRRYIADGNYPSYTNSGTSSESGLLLLKNLTVSGFYQETVGTFLDSEAIEYNKSKNSLATLRQLLQIDVNDQLGSHDTFFMRDWFVYEPAYPFENDCPQTLGRPPGDCNADFYNQYGIRELWLKDTRGPLELYIGRQIVTWGESLSFRVGDQINPQNASWAFGFANLEQSRIPLWMLHPTLNLPDTGPMTSNFLEVVYIPGADFLYTQVDNSTDTIDGQDQVAGRANVSAPSGSRFRVGPITGAEALSLIPELMG